MSDIIKNKIINSLKSLSMSVNDKETLANYIVKALNNTSSGGGGSIKLPIFNTIDGVVDTSLENPHVDITFRETDSNGNPVYETKVYVPQGLNGKDGKDGKDGKNGTNGTNGVNGKTPVFDIIQVITLEHTEEAYANVTKNGTDAEGNPKYNITFGIPKGTPGTGGSSGGSSSSDNVGRLLLVNANNLSTGQTIRNTSIYNFVGQPNNPSTTEKFREFDICMDFYKNIFKITNISVDGTSATIGDQLSK